MEQMVGRETLKAGDRDFSVDFIQTDAGYKYIFDYRSLTGTLGNPVWNAGVYGFFATIEEATIHFKANCPEPERYAYYKTLPSSPWIAQDINKKPRAAHLKWLGKEKQMNWPGF